MAKLTHFKHLQERCDQKLDQFLNIQQAPSSRLITAMRYAVFNGGKRLRPILTYVTGELLGVDLASLDSAACAIELIHAYSLVHDDLPAMDDDDFRRGKPSCHKAFDEATAILVGDALQSLAFQILAEHNTDISHRQALAMVAELAKVSGQAGMAGGQALDLQQTGQSADLASIEKLYHLKTGALFSACINMALIAAPDLMPSRRKSLQDFARDFSFAFQIQDDIQDIEGDITSLGKPPGSDSRQDKSTYPAVAGLEKAKLVVTQLSEKTLAYLETWEARSEPLCLLMKQLFPVSIHGSACLDKGHYSR